MINRLNFDVARFAGNWTNYALPIAITVIVLGFALAEPAFLSVENLLGIVRQMTLVGIMAVAMTFVIMTGGVDLSVGPVLALSGLVSFFALDAGMPLPLVIAGGLGVGILVGLANGFLVAFFSLPPIIVTLATLSIVRGLALILGGPELHLIRGHESYTFIGSGNILNLPFSIYVFIFATLLLMFLQNRTALGLRVAGIGQNERAAFLSGYPVRLTKTLLYVLSALGAAIAGIIQSSQVHTAAATYGPFGIELDVIAAVVLGGTSLMGGNGSIVKTIIGVLFLGVINNGMNILNVPLDIQLIAKGIIIVLSLGLSEFRS